MIKLDNLAQKKEKKIKESFRSISGEKEERSTTATTFDPWFPVGWFQTGTMSPRRRSVRRLEEMCMKLVCKSFASACEQLESAYSKYENKSRTCDTSGDIPTSTGKIRKVTGNQLVARLVLDR